MSKRGSINVMMDNLAFSLQKVGGVSEYWGKLVKSFDEDPQIDLEMIERDDAIGNYTRKSISPLYSPIRRSRFKNLRLDEISRIDTQMKSPGIFHSSYFRTSKQDSLINVTTIHDFIAAKYYKGFLRAFSLWQMRWAVKYSDAIICISESTKRDLLRYIPQAASLPIRIINQGYNSADYKFDPTIDSAINDDVVFIGRRSADYKNFKLSVEAVALNGQVRLMIIGAPLSEEERRYLDDRIPGRYESLEYPESREVARILQSSLCLLYPSEYEGFGLPILEGMACGAPVIAINRSSIPEVAGGNALLLNDSNPQAISDYINQLLSSDDMFREHRSQGLEHVKNFSWEKTAQATKQYYFDLLGKEA